MGLIPFIMVGDYDKRNKRMNEERIPLMNQMLSKYGMYAKYESGVGGEFISFLT